MAAVWTWEGVKFDRGEVAVRCKTLSTPCRSSRSAEGNLRSANGKCSSGRPQTRGTAQSLPSGPTRLEVSSGEAQGKL